MSNIDIQALAKQAGFVSAEFWPDDFKGLHGCVERFATLYREALFAEVLEALQSYTLQIDEKNIALSVIEYGSEAVERELKRRAAIAQYKGEQA